MFGVVVSDGETDLRDSAPDINYHLNPDPQLNVTALMANKGPWSNVRQEGWAFMDFQTGQTSYMDDEDDYAATHQHAVPVAADRVLGTTGLASCTGVVVVRPDCALVAHFSAVLRDL